jgi:adenylate kinase family enzyme
VKSAIIFSSIVHERNCSGRLEVNNFFVPQEILDGVTDIDMVVNLKLREDIIVQKCLGRRICGQCGKNFNLACIDVKAENGLPPIYMSPLLPPKNCMSKLKTRDDDTDEVVRNRLRIYNEMVWHFAFPFVTLLLAAILSFSWL